MSIVAGAKTVTIHLTAPRERGEGRREEDAKLANQIFAGQPKDMNDQNLIRKYAKKNLQVQKVELPLINITLSVRKYLSSK